MGGCWPMLLPMPVLFALFFVFQYTIELRGASFLWLPDLARKDPFYIMPVIMGLSMFGLTKVGQMGMETNPQMKMMTYMMPIMMTVIFLNFASGLNLYYAVSNLASIPQQWLLAKERLRRVPATKPKPASAEAAPGRPSAGPGALGPDRRTRHRRRPLRAGGGPAERGRRVRRRPPCHRRLPDRSAPTATPRHVPRPPPATPSTAGSTPSSPRRRSYTGEDLVELSCHGGLAVPAALVAALQAAGARPAAPGEFTRRAVLNGKLDLVQAEAIGDLIDASAPAQARAALAQLEGGLSRRLGHLRESLLELQAVLGYEIDFPDEDDGPVPHRAHRGKRGRRRRAYRAAHCNRTGRRAPPGRRAGGAGGPAQRRQVLALQRPPGTARALVTETPGTTRDAIEAHTDVLGWPIRLVDTAGLWDSETAIDRLGIEVSRRYLGAADLVLLCVEGARPLGPDEEAVLTDRRALVVRTKSDLPGGAGPDGVSAATGAGLDVLRQRLAAELFSTGAVLADLEPGLTRERHRVALTRAREALAGARPHLARGGDAVLAAHHVREAAAALEELLGGMDVEEVLGRVFASFCVGK